MRINKKIQKTVGINTISYDQFEELHYASLEILESVGVKVFDKEAIKLLKNAGAMVDGNLVKIPCWMVEEALASAPCRVVIHNRSGERSMFLEKGRSYYGTGSDTPFTIDIDSGEMRAAKKQDVVNTAKICESLANIDFVMSLAIAGDVPTKDSYVQQFEAMVLNTEKPIVYTAGNRKDLVDIIKMAEIVAGGEKNLRENPFLVLYDEPSSPLQHSEDAVEKLMYMAEKRLPVIYIPAVMMGATGPVTAAGSITVANCEILSGLVIHQLKAKGAPFVYGGGIPPLDMKTSICSYGAPEEHLNCAILVQMAQYYGLPVFTTAGCSDSQIFDQQAGMEAGFNILSSTLAGGNLIHDLGYIGAGKTSSMEMLVLCNEIVGMAKKYVKGIEINSETLALNVIKKVGPGGDFLSEKHTYNNYREHLWHPDILNRQGHENWKNRDNMTFGQRANEKVKEIISSCKSEELPEELIRKVKKISTDRIH